MPRSCYVTINVGGDAGSDSYDTGTEVCSTVGADGCCSTFDYQGNEQACGYDWTGNGSPSGAGDHFVALCY